jgi:hypothetical protein
MPRPFYWLAASAAALLAFGGVAAAGTTTTTPLTGSITLVDQNWVCDGPVNLDSVTVTITDNAPTIKAIHLRKGCTGQIGNITIVTAKSDGVVVEDGASNIDILGGSISCTARDPSIHQDGIQAMSGSWVTFHHLTINCPTSNNANFFVSWSGTPLTAWPRRIICRDCTLYGTGSSTAFVAKGWNSGLISSTLCPSRYFTFRIASPDYGTIDQNNTYLKSC